MSIKNIVISDFEGEIPAGLCQCGCGEKTWVATYNRPKAGWVKGEPIRYIMNHDKRKFRKPWIVDEKSGCWVWRLKLNVKGYGVCGPRLAHLVIYEKLIGPKPENTTLDHTCRNRACVNPDHLEPVPHIVNCHRGENTRLTTGDVVEIRRLFESGMRSRDVAARFGIARDYAKSIANMKNRVRG